MGPEVVAAATIGSLALDAGSSVVKGYGEKQGQDFMAGQAERAAALGKIKATQTDVAMRDELDTTLGMIEVTRAAAGADPLSPTALAINAKETEVSDRNRTQAVANIRAQAEEREAEARYRRGAGKTALLASYLGAGARLGKGVAKGAKEGWS